MTTPRDPLAESLRAALDAEPATADEDALLARALERAIARTSPEASTKPAAAPADDHSADAPATPVRPVRALGSIGKKRRGGRVFRYTLPLAAAFAASIAMAAVYVVARRPVEPSRDAARSVPAAATSAAPLPPTGASTLPAVAPAPEDAPTVSIDDLPNAPPRASGSPAHVQAPADLPSPADLFSDANAARRTGDVGKAVELYRTLATRYPDAPEAHASRVTLGRLLLDKQGDVAGALAQFDAYLGSSSSDRALAEEARLGRALVFSRQGRQEEERRAWQELLDRHPNSLHAARARERLRALAPAAAPGGGSPSPSP